MLQLRSLWAHRSIQLFLSTSRRQHQPACFPPVTTRSHSTWPLASSPTKKVGQKQRKTPFYNISNTVLDLDAENHPRVRPYDEVIEAEQVDQWGNNYASIDALAERLVSFEKESKDALQRMNATAAAPTPWRVTNRDIMSVALLGHEAGSGAKVEAEDTATQKMPEAVLLDRLMLENGISPRAASDPSKLIDSLLHRRDRGDQADLKRLDDCDEFRDVLLHCQTVSELRRLLFSAIQSENGAAYVSTANRLFRNVGREPEEDPMANIKDVNPTAVVELLVDLKYHLEGKGLQLADHLNKLGLKNAVLAGEPAAMRHFLSGCDPSDHRFDPSELCTYMTLLHESVHEGRFFGTGTELYMLLTGRRLVDRTTAPATAAKASFRFLVLRGREEKKPTSHQSLEMAWPPYLSVLAELGSVRTLWEDLRLLDKGPRAQGIQPAMLATAVLRYAAYTTSLRRWTTQKPAEKTGEKEEEEEKKNRGENSLMDLWMLRTYDDAAAKVAAATAPTFVTVRPAAIQLPEAAADAIHMRHSSFYAEAVAAFAQPAMGEAMASIRALLHRHGYLSEAPTAQ